MNGWHRKRRNAATLARQAEYRSPRYKTARAVVKAQVDAGVGRCWRCGGHIPPGSSWHLGHHDQDRRILMGAEHSHCNLRAAARKGALIANANRKARKAQRNGGTTALRM